MIGSSLVLSWLIVHDGVMRRSEEELSETTMSGTSAMVALAIATWVESWGVQHCECKISETQHLRSSW